MFLLSFLALAPKSPVLPSLGQGLLNFALDGVKVGLTVVQEAVSVFVDFFNLVVWVANCC